MPETNSGRARQAHPIALENRGNARGLTQALED
jgi:hypothetical protein